MIQLPPERERIAFDICQGMWGDERACLASTTKDDVHWAAALRAADALLAKYGPPEPSRRIFPDGERHGFLDPCTIGPAVDARVDPSWRRP